MTEQRLETNYSEVKEALEHLGLSSYEAKLYLFIVTHVPMSASHIAKELDFDRSKVYREIETLMQKGLLSQTLDNPRLCILTDCSTAIDGMIREWEDRCINGKKNKLKIVDFVNSSSIKKTSSDNHPTHITILTSRYAVYYHMVSQLGKCESDVIIYTSAVDLARMQYTQIPEELYKISKKGNKCTIVIDGDVNQINKKYKGCKIIKIRKPIDGRIVIIEDELVIMSSTFDKRSSYKDMNDISLAIKEPQIIRNMQYFIKLVLG